MSTGRMVALALDLIAVASLLIAVTGGAAGAALAVTVAALTGYLAGRWHGGIRYPRGNW